MEMNVDHPLIHCWKDDSGFHMDVRELIEAGGEPYTYIMEGINLIEGKNRLVVHALFEPLPLIRQVERMGLLSESQRESEDHWTLTIFRKG